MNSVKLSPKYQIVIPKHARESLKMKPGQEVQVLVYAGRIELIPLLPPKAMRGFLRGIDTTVPRESDRE